MRHYEMVLMFHPDQSNQVASIVEKYLQQIKDAKGVIHRHEDIGRRQLAYPIEKLQKAHYVLLNVELDGAVSTALDEAFSMNDAIIRHMILRTKDAVTGDSPLLKPVDEPVHTLKPEGRPKKAAPESDSDSEAA